MSVPRVLTIATSDSGGGAGIQADLKAFAAAGCHGMSALVALTAQNTTAVTAVHELPPDVIRAQLDAVFNDLGVDAAKTGMLFSRTIIETVAEFLERHPVPLVVDPVLIASSGAQLLQDDAVQILIDRLFPLATVVTPNLPEAETLTGIRGATRRELAERLVDLGAAAALVTGGHGKSLNAFNPAVGQWQQYWIGQDGNPTEFRESSWAGTSIVFRAHVPAARTTPATEMRLTFTPVDSNTVRQHGESSTDGGATWKTTYLFVYHRKR